jgi:CRISPR-associated endonuclease/helicase Cas3
LAEPLPSREITVEHLEVADPEDALAPRLVEAARSGAMVCWIRNTVVEAQAAWLAARKAGGAPVLFHARMRGKDRGALEREVLDRFGPHGRRGGALLIATQVVEQSLDLDFDLLVTDLAPVDLVLQRAGRLHRHRTTYRPADFTVPRLVLVEPPRDETARVQFGPSGHVYDPATLWLSHDALSGRDRLSVPSEIRMLVESTYAPASRAARIAAAANEPLAAAEDRRALERDAREGDARRVCLPPAATAPGEFRAFDDDDETVQALTRDGASTTLLLVQWDGEVGRSIDGGDPWGLDPEREDARKSASELHEETISVPAYPWETVERGARARGEPGRWDEWLASFERFGAAMGLYGVVAVPVRPHGDEFRGSVEVSRKTGTLRRRLAYSRSRGLWFRREDEA